jgi:arsenate reductase (thioredoxin)
MTTKVLFLCTGNSARSQMAEAFMRHYAADRFEPYSAGLKPIDINPLTIQVMKEIGIDISQQVSKGIGVYLGKEFFHYLITVCDEADKNCPTTWPGVTKRMHWSFEDPAAFEGTDEEKLLKFRQIRDQIDEKIKEFLAHQTD